MTTPDRGTSPLPGENTLTVKVFLAFTAASVVALLAYAAAMIWGSATATGFWVLVVLTAVCLGGLAYAMATRARYLAKVRNGDVIERERWSGADLLPPG
jgi:hypothetical protein